MRDKDLNQSSLARQTGIPRGTINSWHIGTKNPSLDYIVTLAIFFDCKTDYLLGLEDEFGNKNRNV